MNDPESFPASDESKVGRRRKLWPWILLAIGVGSLFLLNGPGARWILPRVAGHYLGKSGIRSDFKVKGSVMGGFQLSDLAIQSDGALAELQIDQVTPDYRLADLWKGKFGGLILDGVRVDLRLDKEKGQKVENPLDLKQIVQTLRSVREKVIPLNLEFKNISVAATRDDKSVLILATSRISKKAGESKIYLDLGVITDANGKKSLEQKPKIVWGTDDVSVERIELLPDVSLRELVVGLPSGEEPSVNGRLHLDEAVFAITSSPGFSMAKIELREGKLPLEKTFDRFGVTLPIAGTLSSFTVDLDGILPKPADAMGRVKMGLENLNWDGWISRELSIDLALTNEGLGLKFDGIAWGSNFSGNASAPLLRSPSGLLLGDIKGEFGVAEMRAVFGELARRIPQLDAGANVPESSLDSNFTLSLSGNQVQSANVNLVLKPEDEKQASAITLDSLFTVDQSIQTELKMEGLKADFNYEIATSAYQSNIEMDRFRSERLNRWLAMAKIKSETLVEITGNWTGAGEFRNHQHTGKVSLQSATWLRENAVPVVATGAVGYDWPESFQTEDLKLSMSGQTIEMEAGVQNKLLEVGKFILSNEGKELATGTAIFPIPEDLSQLKSSLSRETRPWVVSAQSGVIPLGLLKQWLPAFEKVDSSSTGQMDLNISGTYAKPVILAKLKARDLRSPAQPSLPPADLEIELMGQEGRITVEGIATAPDFAPASIKASMPFQVAEWLENPAILKEEEIHGAVDLPRLDLSRFSTLVPIAERISGIVSGKAILSGKVGKPEIQGALSLSAAGIMFKNDRFPDISGATAAVDLALDQIVLKSLRLSIAGGTFDGSGAAMITENGLGELNFRFRADHLPLARNDSLIVRASAELKLQGAWERAALSGSVSIVDSLFYRDIELLPIGVPFTGPAAAKLPQIDLPQKQVYQMPQPFANWGLNVTVATGDRFLIRGNLATGEVEGSVRVGGTLSQPAPNGKFTVRNLRAELPFSTLSVRSGTLTFTPESGFDPILEIRGTSEPRPYFVTIYAYGRASDPKLLLTSNPPLPENEIMTLLATGATTEGLEDPQVASSRALQLLAEELRRGRFRFGKQLRPLLGLLDRVDFSLAEADPYSSESFSTATLSITDRWFLSAGVGGEGDSRFLAIWRLSFR